MNSRKPHRHSTGGLDGDDSYSSRRQTTTTNANNNMDASELSLSDLAPIKPSRRRIVKSHTMDNSSSRTASTMNSSYDHSRRRRAKSHAMDNSSSRTATTMNSSYNQSSSLDFSRPPTFDSGDSSTLLPPPELHRRSTFDSSDYSIVGPPELRRRFTFDSSDSRRRELRNLKGIRQRRSDPVTRRWREQCSKIYKEQVLNSYPEQPPPLLMTLSPRKTVETVAARTIQAFVRRFLRKKHGG